jgi:protein-ribulosamine 3-kinase
MNSRGSSLIPPETLAHPPSFPSVAEAISEATETSFTTEENTAISGGCINQTSRLKGKDDRIFFLKQNNLDFLSFFESEAEALIEIRKTGTVRVPDVITFGTTEEASFLVLSLFEEEPSTSSSQEQLGSQLGRLHAIEQPFFGWHRDNCIGATPQPNPPSEDWVSFYRDQRLGHQFDLAKKKGKSFPGSSSLLNNLSFFFVDYLPKAALLHGDLWGGNTSVDLKGPIVYDPASYYGDRETDLAFTYMFGGFTSSFYQAYEEVYPLDAGFGIRKILYNLYHELNHFNLFGGGYASSAQSSVNQLLDHLS